MAAWINDYLAVPYVDGGRDCLGFDCWGLARHVLHHHYGVPWLASFGHVDPDDKPAMTKCYQHVVKTFAPGACVSGAVACGFIEDCLVHVGVVVNNGHLRILHTSKQFGRPGLIMPRAFRRLFERTEYYEYQHDRNH